MSYVSRFTYMYNMKNVFHLGNMQLIEKLVKDRESASYFHRFAMLLINIYKDEKTYSEPCGFGICNLFVFSR